MKFWWPLFLAFKNPTFFWPKVTFEFLNVPRRESTGNRFGQDFEIGVLWLKIDQYLEPDVWSRFRS